MKFRLFLILFVFFSVLAKSQDRKDSVYIFTQDRIQIDKKILSPTFAELNKSTAYGVLELDYLFETGGLRKAQQAYDKRSPTFTAKGFNELGKFRLGAIFKFNNSFEDSLANGQKNDLENLSTFYPYANKAGDYNRQNYSISTSLSYRIFDNLIPFINMDYHKHMSAGTVDPRLSSNRFILKLKPGISTNFKKHHLGLYGILGNADEQVSLQYKNAEYKVSLLYPDRIHYMNYGYGNSVIKDSSNVYKYDMYRGFGMQYAGNIDSWSVFANGAYEYYHNANFNNPRSSSRHTTPIGVFDLYTTSFSVDAHRDGRNGRQQSVLFSAVHNEGIDGNLKTTGSLNIVNYKVNTLNLNGSYYYLWDKNKSYAKELGISLAYCKDSRADISQGVLLDVSNTLVSVFHTQYFQGKFSQSYQFTLNPYYSFPNNTSLSFNPLSSTPFLQNVIFTDYYFAKTSFWGLKVGGEYKNTLFGNNNLGIYASIDYRKANDLELRTDLNPTFIPNGHRLIGNIGLRMYLKAN
ncbi:DUF6850 family outer membrane beta-barrel protein [Sphingobacterium hungaricum]